MKKLKNNWYDVGVHPTPLHLVDEFSDYISNYYVDNRNSDLTASIRMLDLFAGDGRLGSAVVSKILEENIKVSNITFIENDERYAQNISRKNKKNKILTEDVYSWSSHHKFDLIVSNPPYLSLNKELSKKFSLPWKDVQMYGNNLYGMGIIKGLELCRPGGVVAVIAPFGWTRGDLSSKLRDVIDSLCEDVVIRAYPHRGIFEGVNQDIAFQIFKKKENNSSSNARVRFAYNGYALESINISNTLNPIKFNPNRNKARIGNLVWNQRRDDLSSRKTGVPIIYGGNIRPTETLEFDIEKYKQRQYISKSKISSHEIVKSPVLFIRRTLRGRPGNWKVDSCARFRGLTCVPENHVIAIELPKNISANKLVAFKEELVKTIESYYSVSGTPNISVKVVNKIIDEIQTNKLK